jgi:hypothetical protein
MQSKMLYILTFFWRLTGGSGYIIHISQLIYHVAKNAEPLEMKEHGNIECCFNLFM